jgi:hypothetical protein
MAVLLLLAGSTLWASPSRLPQRPFTFIYDLQGERGQRTLLDYGLTTHYLTLQPRDVIRLEAIRAEIRQAAAKGLMVVAGLPTGLTEGTAVSPYDRAYRGQVQELVGYLVRELGAEPGLTAWATADYLERQLRFTDEDFRLFLQARYPAFEALNEAWGARLPTWAQINMKTPESLDAGALHRVGRASVDLADYKAAAYHEVMAHWLAAIRAADPLRPVLTGRVSLYRSLLSVPDGYDVICVSMPPSVLEADYLGHNMQALDMARRGGKFAVLAVLEPPVPGMAAHTDERLKDWVNLAAVHGACGVAFAPLEALEDGLSIERRQRDRDQRIGSALRATAGMVWGEQPRATTAVLYSPYAAGFEVSAQPVYGYLRGLLPGQPSGLLADLGRGTRWGGIDVLGVADLASSELSGYGAIIAPACLSLPPEGSEALDRYVAQGGALLADLGLGMAQSGAWELPPAPWADLLGLAEIVSVGVRVGNLTVGESLPDLPSVRRGMVSRGTYRAGAGSSSGPATGRLTYTFGGPVAEVRLREGALPLAVAGVRFDRERRPLFAGLIANRSGRGLTLYATHTLWTDWPLSDPLSQALHGDLLARRARVVDNRATGLMQSGVHWSAGAESLTAANTGRHEAPLNLTVMSAGSRAVLGGASRHLAAPQAAGWPPGTVQVEGLIPGKGQLALKLVPLLVQPYAGQVTAMVAECTQAGVEFTIGGPDAVLRAQGGALRMTATQPAEVRVVLRDGAYRVEPGSGHEVRRVSRGGQETRHSLTANERGELDLSGVFRQDRISISPRQ